MTLPRAYGLTGSGAANQDLNTTDTVTFAGITSTGDLQVDDQAGFGIAPDAAYPLSIQTTTNEEGLRIVGRDNGAVDESTITFLENNGTDSQSNIRGESGTVTIAQGTGEALCATFGSTGSSPRITAAADIDITGFLYSGITNSITAGTTQTQAGATALTALENRISVCANSGDGVLLPSSSIRKNCNIINQGAQPLRIWPDGTNGANGGGAGLADPTDLAAGESRNYRAFNGGNWFSGV